MQRKGDKHRHKGEAFRTSRIYAQNEHWWVATREGDRGPYPTRDFALLVAAHVKNSHAV